MKALNVLTLLLGIPVWMSAQDQSPNYRQPGDPARVTYEAFRVDQLARQADVSPTGDVAFSIPILVVPNRLGHDWQLKLDYHSAVSQRQRASWVGLGWDLELGYVERTIMGRSDDQIRGLPNGELGGNTGQHTERSEGWGRLWDNHNKNASCASADTFDQADVYRLSVEGSGTEILPFPSLRPSLCTDSIKVSPESFLPIQYKPWTIQAFGWPNGNNQIGTFYLRKEDRTQNFFGNYDGEEGVDSITVRSLPGQPVQRFQYPYRWNLVKVRYPDGVTATIHYYRSNASSGERPFIHTWDQVQIDRSDTIDYPNNLFGKTGSDSVHGKVQYGYSRPCTLKTETHYAVFFARTPGDWSTDRNSELDSIVLYDRKSSSRLKTVVFTYADSSNNDDSLWQSREKLNDDQLTFLEVKVVGSDGTQLPSYKFQYLANPRAGDEYLTTYSRTDPQFPGHFSDADGATTADEYAKAWKLKRVTLPTGGTVDYTYERISDVAYDPEGAPWPVYGGSRHWGYKSEPRGRVTSKTVTNDLGEVRTWTYAYGPALFDWPSRVYSSSYIPTVYRSLLLGDPTYPNYYQIFRGCPIVHRWITVTAPDTSSRRVHFTTSYCGEDAHPMERCPDSVAFSYPIVDHATTIWSRAGRRGLIWKEVYNGIDSTIYHYAFSEEGGMQDRYQYYRYFGPGSHGQYVYNTSVWARPDTVTVVRDGVTLKTVTSYANTPRMSPRGGGGVRTVKEIGNKFDRLTDYVYASEVYPAMDTIGMFSQTYSVKASRDSAGSLRTEKLQWTKWASLDSAGVMIDVYAPSSEWVSTNGADSIKVLDYTDYDIYANIARTTDANGLATTFIYGSYNTPSGSQVYENAYLRRIERSINAVSLGRDFEYTPLGQVSKITDENSKVTQFQYDGLGRLKTVLGPEGITTNEYSYYVSDPEEGNCIEVRDYRFPSTYKETNYYADNLGQTYQTQVALGNKALVTHTTYDPLWRVLREYKPFVNTGMYRDDQAHAHDSAYYARLGIQVGSRPFTSNVYDKSGRILEQHGPGPTFDTSFVKTRYAANVESDSAGYPVGTLFRTTSYDENKGANNQVSQEFRDVLGNIVLTRTDSAGLRLTTCFERDASGRVLSVVRPDRSAKLTYEYDSRGLLKDKSTPEQGTVQYLYDRMGNLRFTKDANHTASSGNGVYVFGQYTGSFSDSGQFVLNMPGRIRTAMDNQHEGEATITLTLKAANGTEIAQFSQNVRGARWDTVFLPKGTYKYLVQASSEEEAEFQYQILCQNFLDFIYQKYDSLGRTVERGEVEASSFGAFTQANANTPSYPTSSRVVERTNVYDTASTDAAVSGLQHNLLGRLSYTVVYRLGESVMTTFYSYDTYGRLEWIVRTGSVIGSYPKRIYYSYDMQGNILKKSYVDDYSSANNFSVWYEYDEAGRLARLFAGTDSVSRVKEAEYVYYANGAVDTLRLGAAETVDHSYNERDWTTEINSTRFKEKLGYNNLDEVCSAVQATPQYNGNISWTTHYIYGLTIGVGSFRGSWIGYTFTYDRANRLTVADLGFRRDVNQVWYNTSSYDMPLISYDPDGNIDSLVRKSRYAEEMDKLKYHYGTSSSLLYVSDAGSDTTSSTDIDNQPTNNYGYDANGNVVQDLENGIGFLIYDINNLPVSMHRTGGSAICYTYDQAGGRVEKVDGTTTTQYILDADGQPFAILDPAYQTKPTYYLHGLDLVGQVNRDGSSLTRYYYLKDHLGSICVRVNSSDSVMAYDDFYPYGQIMDGRSSSTGMPDTRFKYTGKERDVESQYDYFGARYYDARIGRWLGVDPWAERGASWSPYVYVEDDPIGGFDPDGRHRVWAFSGRGNAGYVFATRVDRTQASVVYPFEVLPGVGGVVAGMRLMRDDPSWGVPSAIECGWAAVGGKLLTEAVGALGREMSKVVDGMRELSASGLMIRALAADEAVFDLLRQTGILIDVAPILENDIVTGLKGSNGTVMMLNPEIWKRRGWTGENLEEAEAFLKAEILETLKSVAYDVYQQIYEDDDPNSLRSRMRRALNPAFDARSTAPTDYTRVNR